MELNEDEKINMNYKIGETPLRLIPISRDPKLTYTQRPLYDNSINFGLQLNREEFDIPPNLNGVEKLMNQNKKRDLSACYKRLGHVKSPGKQVDYGKGVPSTPKRAAYRSLPRFMTNNTNRNGVIHASEKSLAEVASEQW